MNPSFPGSSGDRHAPPQQQLGGAGGGMNKQAGGPPPHAYHAQPQLAQLPHPGHHGPSSLHPLHGGGGHNSSILHSGPPPPLPPPPLTSLGGSGSARSPHHSLPGSILHPPRSNMSGGPGGPSVLGKPGGLGGPGGSNSQGGSGGSVLMSHPLRLQAQGPTSAGPSGNTNSMSNASGGMKPAQSYGMRPPSPRRDGGNANAGQQVQHVKYILERTPEGDDGYYGGMNKGQMGAPRHRELRVEDALLYLDQVKQQFGDQPDIYNQFLDVMKDFKAQAIDTPGVILRVSNLFRGYPNLILGFNTFLPPGYRIRPDTSIEVIPPQMQSRQGPQQSMFSGSVQQQQQQQQSAPAGKQTTPSRQNMGSALQSSQPKSGQQGQGKSGMAKKPQGQMPNAAPGGQGQSGGNSSRSSTNPLEFDHAIHYVTTIKQRFADEPETYKEFLAILHTYQKEQRSIRQVLDQVSYLFRDHPDLLREFTFFLPDAVQEQAKERLNRAAEKAQQRKDQMAKPGKYMGNIASLPPHVQRAYEQPLPLGAPRRRDDNVGSHMPGMESPSTAAMKGRMAPDDRSLAAEDMRNKAGRGNAERTKPELGYRHPSPIDDRSGKGLERRDKDRERDRNKALFAHKRSKRRTYDSKERRDFLAMSDVIVDKEEWGIFEKIKKILPSRDNWREFLKCLELYSQEVLGRAEMMSLIKNLFGRHTDLVEEFDALLCSHGEQKNPQEIWPFIPLAETDLSQCRRATPSYRALPASYPIPPCSYRSKLEKTVCNDSWVSVPTGSEDFSFKNMRKNQYEEALFKCEDERFEIDMVIDANSSTISALEPLAREIEVLKDKEGGEDKLWNYVVDKGTFRVTHLNAITRIYGEAGPQILDLLRKYPAGAIPVILKRLKQKDEEWRRARQDLNKQWKEVNEKNYHKSLDHSSFYFKQKDKKQTSMKVLLQEAKKKLETEEKHAVEHVKTDANPAEANGHNAPPAANEIAKALNKEQPQANGDGPAPTPEWKPHFQYKFAAAQIHKDAFGLLTYAAEKNLGTADKEKVSKVWQSFFFPFFALQEEWLVRKPKRTTVTLEKAKQLRMGTEVSTDFGEGTIQYFNEVRGNYVVNLPIGHAYLQPGSITVEESSDFPPTVKELDDEENAKKEQDESKSVFFGSQHAYVFLRLYQLLHNRLERAHELCEKAKRNRYRRTINPAARALAHARHTLNDTSGKEKTGDYQAFLSKLYALIDGSVDNTKYEDCCRSLMGSTSYFLFTMDKLVSLILKQMQHLATDDTCQELLKVFAEQNEARNAGAIDVTAYLNKTKSIFEGEGAFRIEYSPGVLRRTPLEPRATTPAAADGANFKIWAPSPRVRQQEPSRWLIEPRLCIEYLGSMEDEGDDDENEDSPSATPPETPSQTPVFGSPYREGFDDAEKKDDAENGNDNGNDGDVDLDNENENDNEGENDERGTNSGEESADGSSDDEESNRKDLTSVLKKRSRPESEDGNNTDESMSAPKKTKTEEQADEQTGEDTAEENMDEDSGVPDSQDDPMTGTGDDDNDAEADGNTGDDEPMPEAASSPSKSESESKVTDEVDTAGPSDEPAKAESVDNAGDKAEAQGSEEEKEVRKETDSTEKETTDDKADDKEEREKEEKAADDKEEDKKGENSDAEKASADAPASAN